MTTYRIRFTDAEGRLARGENYDPAHPLTEDVNAVRINQDGPVWEFYDAAGSLVHTAGALAVAAIEEVDEGTATAGAGDEGPAGEPRDAAPASGGADATAEPEPAPTKSQRRKRP